MSFKVIAGDFPENSSLDKKYGELNLVHGFLNTKSVVLSYNIESLDVITEENKKKILGATGWGLASGIAAGILTGGLGAIVAGAAGVLAGGNKKEITFACRLKDGRKFLAVSDPNTYKKILAVFF